MKIKIRRQIRRTSLNCPLPAAKEGSGRHDTVYYSYHRHHRLIICMNSFSCRGGGGAAFHRVLILNKREKVNNTLRCGEKLLIFFSRLHTPHNGTSKAALVGHYTSDSVRKIILDQVPNHHHPLFLLIFISVFVLVASF
jgi:hypothetical protein